MGKPSIERKCLQCGKKFYAWPYEIKSGQAKYCSKKCVGLSQRGKKGDTRLDVAGKRFGKLVAIKPTGEIRHGCVVWLCQCDCGKAANVKSTHLARGLTRSCGCLVSRKGKKHPNWRGGRFKINGGYIDVYDVKAPGKRRYIPEHRIVAEAMIGRPLKEDEVVHHKNGNPSDNRPENLEVMTRAEHAKHHLEERMIKERAEKKEAC